MSGQITNAEHAKAFILAGKAAFTLRSLVSGTRYTFRVIRQEDDTGKSEGFYIRTLVGADNENDYIGIGFLNTSRPTIVAGVPVPKYWQGKGKGKPQAAVFEWFVTNLFNRNRLSDKVELWHAGKCGRCNRQLTVPASIASGIGPECANKMGFLCD